MFAYDFAHWAAFLSAALLLNLAPGPDIAFILGHTLKGGRRSGLAAMLGIWTGAMGHVLLAALGLSAMLAISDTAFGLVQWLGAGYLVWLGIRALRDGGSTFVDAARGTSQSAWPIFRQGVLVDLLNPKVAVFFLAFLPQFVVDGAGPVWAQLLMHGVLIIFVAALVEPPLILLGDRLVACLRGNRNLALYLDRSLGIILIALGVRLALV
jgi:threonine/homoserine/homoserine lactone efflux protein